MKKWMILVGNHGGQFESATHGQFKSAEGGQFCRRLEY
jgi:hypothetical protein